MFEEEVENSSEAEMEGVKVVTLFFFVTEARDR
jgi:hypothetical protein